jgi:hypothetical protein
MSNKKNSVFQTTHEEIVFSKASFADFEASMTRQLNCLVGRWLRFTTPQSVTNQSFGRQSTRANSAAGISKRER